MENRAYPLIVGLFTLVLGLSALLAFWWFSGGAQDTRAYLIVSPRSVTGLNPQAAVRYRGVRVGKVTDVDLQDTLEVNIQIRIDSDIPITRGTRARSDSSVREARRPRDRAQAAGPGHRARTGTATR